MRLTDMCASKRAFDGVCSSPLLKAKLKLIKREQASRRKQHAQSIMDFFRMIAYHSHCNFPDFPPFAKKNPTLCRNCEIAPFCPHSFNVCQHHSHIDFN